MVGLFILLVIILAVNPKVVKNIYDTFLGRVFLIGITVFFAMYNRTLGLLVVLTIIAGLNQFGSFTEGFKPVSVGDDSDVDKGDKVVLTKEAVAEAVDKKKKELNEDGIDMEAIKAAIMSKDPKAIPTDPKMTSSEDVSAFKEGMLKSSSRLEGYSNYASV